MPAWFLALSFLAATSAMPAAHDSAAVATPVMHLIGSPLDYPPWEIMKHDFRECEVVAHVQITAIDTAKVIWTDSSSVAPRQIGFIVYKVAANVIEVFEDRHGQARRAHEIAYRSSIESGSAWREEMLSQRDRIVFLNHAPHAPANTFDEVKNSGVAATPDLIEKLKAFAKAPPENSGAGHHR